MNIKQVARDTTQVLISYLTYQAVRVILTQLSETNPPLAIWLNGFSSTGKIQNGEAYIQELLQANQELAFRVMSVRSHLVEEVAEYLPEMTRTGIQQANMEHRRQHLERITQLTFDHPVDSPTEDLAEGESETNESSESNSDNRSNRSD